MPKLPRPSGKEMVRFLEGRGMSVVRVAGSHYVMEGRGKRTVIPVHANKTMKIGTLRSILRDIDVSPVEFGELFGR